jgi:hypothetical protein
MPDDLLDDGVGDTLVLADLTEIPPHEGEG